MNQERGQWLPDPSGRHELRYWDGSSWTEHVGDGSDRSTDPLTGEPSKEEEPATEDFAVHAAEAQSADADPVDPNQEQGQPEHPERRWWSRRRFLVPLALAIGMLIGVPLGAASTQSELDDKEAELDAARTAEETAQAEIAELEEALSDTRDDLDDAIARADEAEEIARADARATIRKAQAELREVRDDLDARAEELDVREAEIREDEEIAAKSEFGDGVYEVGVDIIAGTYKTAGTPSCYWEKAPLTGTSIIDNDLPGGPSTVAIEEGILFKSQGCGTWSRVE